MAMKKKMIMKLFIELLKNSRRSDRELARVLGVSQPTVTRYRRKLMNEGMIREFTVIPDFTKMGYEIVAINCFRSKIREGGVEKATKMTNTRPNIIFAGRAHGMGKSSVVISIHKNYTDHCKFMADLLLEGEDDIEEYDVLLISLGDLIVKPFSLSYLTELEEKK